MQILSGSANNPKQGTGITAVGQRALAWTGGVLVAVILAFVLVVVFLDWNWVRAPIAGAASAATGRRVRIDGDLKVDLLTATPTVSVASLKIGQPSWAKAGDMAVIDRLVVQIRWRSLLQGQLNMPLVEIDRPNLNLRRDSQGRSNWSFSNTSNPGAGRLPPIERVVIRAGRVHYEDATRKLMIDGVINSNESTAGPQAHAFDLAGRGVLNAQPFQLRLQGGPLIHVNVDQPYPFSVTIGTGDTRLEANGMLRRPFDFSGYSAVLHATGRDLSDLYYVTGLTLPNSPAYDLRGAVGYSAKLYRFDHLAGRIGGSDVAGAFTVSTASGRPFVDAQLRSRSLDFRDLNAIFGGAPSKSSMAGVKSEVRVAAALRAAEDRMMPDAALYSERLRQMDARLDFRAASITDSPLPLRGVQLKLTLDHGLLIINPLHAAFKQGVLNATITLNARGPTPVTDLDAHLTGLELRSLVPGARPGAAPVEGLLAAHARLHGVGDSVHRAAAAADGSITLVAPKGRIRTAFAELLGVNVGKGLSLLLSKNKGETNIRCGVASFDVHNGEMSVRQIMLDTDVVQVNGSGGGNLGSETFQIVLTGATKKFRLTHVFLPITVGGHFRSPTLGVQPGPAIAQGGVGLLVGAVLSPLAAILPFVDAGQAKDADCPAVLAAANGDDAAAAAQPRQGAH